MAHKNITQIVQNLSELLDAVEADTEKTTKQLETTKQKQKAFFEDFWYHVDSYYRDILFQYNRMREETRTALTVSVDNEDTYYTNFEINVSYIDRREAVYVSVKAYDRDSDSMVTCLTATESEDGVRIDYESSALSRKKLAEAIQYIKSGQFDVEFAKVIQLKCKGILEKNEELRQSA